MTTQAAELHDWWGQLRHGGMLVAPALLPEFFPRLAEPDPAAYATLREEWLRFETALAGRDQKALPEHRRLFVGAVLEGFLGLRLWQKGNAVAPQYRVTSYTASHTKQVLRPDWLLLAAHGDGGAMAVVFEHTAERVGMGRGRRTYARLVELLRRTGVPLGLLTNGRQFRVVHAGPDFDAWAEWDAAAWFDITEGRDQLTGLRTLLGREPMSEPGGPVLTRAVQESRHRQGDLAQVLGEQVRQAIEELLGPLDAALGRDPSLLDRIRTDPAGGQRLDGTAVLRALYHAATRVVMRLVVLLYAESRDLLPASLEVYHDSYGVEGLYRTLNEAALHGRVSELAELRTAWPRLLALCDTVHAGTAHEAMPLRPYGGTLFRPGDRSDRDPVLRALAVLEGEPGSQSYEGPDDRTVHRVLRLLRIGRIKVRSGRATTWVAAPVDFSDLRTEYIGIVYEGLLDYELRRAATDDPVVFLNLGRQPALPLSRLEALSDADLKNLVDKLGKDKGSLTLGGDAEDADGEEDAGDEDDVAAEAASGEAGADPAGADDPAGDRGLLIEPDGIAEVEGDPGDADVDRRVRAWAERAVEVAGLVRRPRGRRVNLVDYERLRAQAAGSLISRTVPAGGLYLVAWGGLRKGTGTFYTRPALAVPLTHRTLEPLCYEGEGDERRPRRPEDILALKVCDPAMGSGSFLVAALRYLTRALAESLTIHGGIHEHGDQTAVTLPFGRTATGQSHEELLPVPPDDDRFDLLLTARLARHVVERCIYGVDLNPMAAELARLALWVETLSPELPFEFLDHKLKVGNSLVGCWLHLVEDYPARAWEREGGDGPKGERTKWIKEIYNKQVKPQLADWIGEMGGQLNLFGEAAAGMTELAGRVRERFNAIHDLPAERREAAYRELEIGDDYRILKQALDRWCAVWFWPPRREPALTPSEWREPSFEADEIADELAREHGFFHWEIEFPDAFLNGKSGFDAIIGNPPWEVERPKSEEFFSVHDPLYRTYGRLTALTVQERLFVQHPQIAEDWVSYQARFRALRTWVDAVAHPFDVTLVRGKAGGRLRRSWEEQRAPREQTASPHPFRHQGAADLNTYKLFLEASHHLLGSTGRLGMVVPSGIWTDLGLAQLRRLFLEQCQWEWCFGFENRAKIFPIDSRYKFAPIILQRGGRTEEVRAAFMRHDAEEWTRPVPFSLTTNLNDIGRFSPKTLSFMEFASQQDVELVRRLYGEYSLLGEVLERLAAEYYREFHATEDAKSFLPLSVLTNEGVRRESDLRDPRVRARLRRAGFLPLYEGRSIWLHNPYFKGRGSSGWRTVKEDVLAEKSTTGGWRAPRLAFREVASSTNQRTVIAAIIPPSAHHNKAPALDGLGDEKLPLLAALTSLLGDYIIRMKVSATVNWFYLETFPVPDLAAPAAVARLAADLVWRLNALGAEFEKPAKDPIVDPAERMAARLLLDALVARVYRITPYDMAHIATRFPIYDRKDTARGGEVPEEFRYPNLAVRVFEAYHFDGVEAAEAEAKRLTEARRAAGIGFGLDEVYVPPGGWEQANREAREILEGG